MWPNLHFGSYNRKIYSIPHNYKITLLEYLTKVKYNTDIFKCSIEKSYIAYTK